MNLSAEIDRRQSLLLRSRNDGLHDRSADAAAAEGPEHGNAADMTVGKHACAAFDHAAAVKRHEMLGLGVVLVHFQFAGHLLLGDEYHEPHPLAFMLIGLPVAVLDRNCICHRVFSVDTREFAGGTVRSFYAVRRTTENSERS